MTAWSYPSKNIVTPVVKPLLVILLSCVPSIARKKRIGLQFADVCNCAGTSKLQVSPLRRKSVGPSTMLRVEMTELGWYGDMNRKHSRVAAILPPALLLRPFIRRICWQ
jgi:hypothetical protein